MEDKKKVVNPLDKALVDTLQHYEQICRDTLSWVFRDAKVDFNKPYQVLPWKMVVADHDFTADVAAEFEEYIIAEVELYTRRVHVEIQADSLRNMATRMLTYAIGLGAKLDGSQDIVFPLQRVVCLRQRRQHDPAMVSLRCAMAHGKLAVEYDVPIVYLDDECALTLFGSLHRAQAAPQSKEMVGAALTRITSRILDEGVRQDYRRNMREGIKIRCTGEVADMRLDENDPFVKILIDDIKQEGKPEARRQSAVRMYKLGKSFTEIEQLLDFRIADDQILSEAFALAEKERTTPDKRNPGVAKLQLPEEK